MRHAAESSSLANPDIRRTAWSRSPDDRATSLAVGLGALAVATAAVALPLLAHKLRGTVGHQSVRGKLVVITGGSRGLGLALAEEFANRGARLALIARDKDELNQARHILESKVRSGLNDVGIFPCDITSESDVKRTIAKITSQLGAIDILVNNAGVITVGPLENQPSANFRRAMDVNFYGMLHCTLATLPEMLRRGSGSIVNITSIGGKVSVPHLMPYSSSKFAAVGFSEGLHAEMRGKGVRVTTVCPGLMRNGSFLHAEFTGDAQSEYRWFSLASSVPGITASVASAASRIVDSTEAGDAELTLTPQAVAMARFHGVAPALTAALFSFVNQLLPAKSEERRADQPVIGARVRGKEISSLIALGLRAAERYNEKKLA